MSWVLLAVMVAVIVALSVGARRATIPRTRNQAVEETDQP